MAGLSTTDVLAKMRHEIADAHQMLDSRETVPWYAWCALIADWTGEPTCVVCTGHRHGQSVMVSVGYGVSYGRGDGLPGGEQGVRHEGLLYQHPVAIARKGSVWDMASGGNMAQWILLLENPNERADCLKANHSYAEDREISGEEMAANRRRILQMTRGLLGHMERDRETARSGA